MPLLFLCLWYGEQVTFLMCRIMIVAAVAPPEISCSSSDFLDMQTNGICSSGARIFLDQLSHE